MFAERIKQRAAQAHPNGTARPVNNLDDATLLERARQARNGARFIALYDRGDWRTQGFPSQSEGDLALCATLAFWCGGDEARIDSLFRSSALFREKWNSADYRGRTLTKALAGCSETYSGPRVDGSANGHARVAVDHGDSESGRDEEQTNGDVHPEQDNNNAAGHSTLSTTEDGLALQFVDQHGRQLLYVERWNRWLRYEKGVWRPDDTLAVYDTVRRLCRGVADALKKKESAAELRRAKTVAAVERLARSDRRVAASVDQFDANPWVLNTPGGAVDLRTGLLRPHRRDDFSSKITAVTPAETATCPLWLAFLDRVMGGDEALIKFLQRTAGYALTGITTEQVLFFLYGLGANGKSVFVNTLLGILSDYSTTTPSEVFMESVADRHPTEIADLRGARLVAATETEQGRRWAESKVKKLTGGEKIKARFMRQDFFEYTPQFKLTISGNHRPRLRSVDEAIRRRLRLIPFSVTIPEGERDLHLPEKLKREWPAILRWMVEGCLAWQRDGLNPPAWVLDATRDYLEAEDTLQEWIGERCSTDDVGDFASTAELFSDFKTWTEQRNERPGGSKTFSQSLEDRGFKRGRQKATGPRGFWGIGLIKTSGVS